MDSVFGRTKLNSSPAAVLLTETDGHASNDIAYLKCSDAVSEAIQQQNWPKNTILRLNLSLEPRKTLLHSLQNTVKGIFLPAGYPDSVSPDYAEYQMWDTLQACASTITGTLSTKVILESVGVGKSEASAVSAAVTWNIKQTSGMLAGILFAWLVSSGLDMNCKQWRLFADIVNDVAMCIELIVLPFFNGYTLPILCVSTALKALVGVAGGATRVAITQHQAINQNTGDVSAKDGSQETCVNLITTFVGLGLISFVTDIRLNWCIFFGLTFLHVYANYRAVKSLNFTYFNENRLAVAIEEYLVKERVPCPYETNKKEGVFLFGNRCENLSGHKILIGHPLNVLTVPKVIGTFQLQFLTHLYKDRNYIIIINHQRRETMIALSKEHSPTDLVEAYFHAICHGLALEKRNINAKETKMKEKETVNGSTLFEKIRLASDSESREDTKQHMDFSLIMEVDNLASVHAKRFLLKATECGWDLNQTQLPDGKWRATWRDTGS